MAYFQLIELQVRDSEVKQLLLNYKFTKQIETKLKSISLYEAFQANQSNSKSGTF